MNPKAGFNTLDSYLDRTRHAGTSSSVTENQATKQPLFAVPPTSNKLKQNQSMTGPSTFQMKRSLSNVSAYNGSVARQKLDATEESVLKKASSSRISLRVLTCSIQKINLLQKSYPNLSVLYEVFASVRNLHAGKHPTEILIELRNGVGPILKGIYYNTDSQFSDDIQIGNFVRCVGRFSASGFQVLKIRCVQQKDCAELVQRLETLSNFELHNFLEKQ